MHDAIVADLSHNALIEVSGDDATAFLHGQLTNDVEKLAVGAAQWTGWCSAKGRLLATFLLVKLPESYLLMLPAEIAPAIVKRLKMYVLRSKVVIDDAGGRLRKMGIAGHDAAAVVAKHFGENPAAMRWLEKDGVLCVALDEGRFVMIAPTASTNPLCDALIADARPGGIEAWEWSGIHAGIPTVVARTQEEFVPQMANFELIGGVSFKKGCYPGQEIVARTQYRGVLKKRMARAHVDGAAPQPGDPVFTPAFGEQAAGLIANSAPAPDGGHDVLVVAQLEGISAGDLRLGSPSGTPLSRIERLDLNKGV